LLDPQTKAFIPLAMPSKIQAQGITKDKRVVAYCGGGISATIDLSCCIGSATTTSRCTTPDSMGEWGQG
jgi:thiosulfate/3-mercaptopyruvate sulfurtransferase